MTETDSILETEQNNWQAVTARDALQDGNFVYAVTSTGIYCRPSCASRKPKRENVAFFKRPELAERAGYRACKRCRPADESTSDPQVDKMRVLCRYIEANKDRPVTLAELGAQVGLSASYLQRTFKKVVGVTPRAYLEACRLNAVKAALRQGDDISGATFEAGYGSSSSLYGKADASLGMTPKTYQRKGERVVVCYAVTDCSLGKLLVAATEKGICAVRLGDDATGLEAELFEEFGKADIQRDKVALAAWLATIVAHLDGRVSRLELPLDVRATAFQKRVWQALQNIPYGRTRSYGEVAEAIGQASAVRAVARACAANPTALVVPCHRVVRRDGALSGYRWGAERKRILLQRERGDEEAS